MIGDKLAAVLRNALDKITTAVLVAVFVLIVGLMVLPTACNQLTRRGLENDSKEMIGLLENYKDIHGTYPYYLRDVGIPEAMRDEYTYSRKDSIRYVLRHDTGFDSYWEYDSDKGVWEYPFR